MTYVLVCDVYIILSKQFKLPNVPTMVGSIMVVGELTHCALLHSVYDLKATHMNVQHNEFDLGYVKAEATKNIA